MTTTHIEWADVVWNPTTGCDRVSDGCDNCYALTMAKRLKGMGSAKYQNDGDPRTSGPGFAATMHPDALELPLSWRKPRRVFVNSMSDLYHEKFTDEFIGSVFEVMAKTPQHTYQILTKRHARMRSLLTKWGEQGAAESWAGPGTAVFRRRDLMWVGPVPWPLPNVWLGVSTEDQKWADIRIPALLDTPAAVRWISAEPLLGPIDLTRMGPRRFASALTPSTDQDTNIVRRGLDWVVVGGESGPGARPMHPSWARALRDQCASAGVPYLFKQFGAHDVDGKRVGKGRAGRELDGRTWDAYPVGVA